MAVEQRSADNSTMTNTEELAERVQSLPPELYREVYDYTCTTRSRVRRINAAYKCPKLLAVDRSSRAKFAGQYYGKDAIFYVSDWTLGRKWLESLAKQHLQLLHQIRCHFGWMGVKPLTGKETTEEWRAYVGCFEFAHGNAFEDFGDLLEPDKVYIAAPYGNSNLEKWVLSVEQLSELRSSLVESDTLAAS